jgi:MFS family permease
LPVFLVALPAGALADVVDRRRLLLVTQGWMLLAAAGLGLLTILGVMTPLILLALTFALGLGAAMNGPAWQAIVAEVVPPAQLQEAVALNAAGFNLARAVGPALGGAIVAAAGPGPVFLLNAASFVGVMFVVYRWQRATRASRLPAEHMIGAIRAGMRYARHSPALQVVLVRSGVFIVCGPALLPRIKRKVSLDALVAGAIVCFASVTLAVAYVRDVYLVGAIMVACGVAWIALMSSFNTAAQTSVPAWVRACALALYLLAFQGGTAVGSMLWGAVAARVGIPAALVCAALGLMAGLAVVTRYRLAGGEPLDLTPSLHWPEPHVVVEPRPEDGPVLVLVEYLIQTERSHDFAAAMRELRGERLRDGAMRWELFNDPAHPQRYVETFLVASWVEHLRQHERVTRADRQAQEVARAFHSAGTPPKVSHLIHQK